MRAILGDDVVAVYVSGSAISGAFNPASSDVDFLVVTQTPVDDDAVRRLTELHHDLAARYEFGGRLEGAYAARNQLRPWGIDGVVAAIEPGRRLRAGVPAEHGPGTMLGIKEACRALAGLPASAVLPEVDAATLERGVRGYLEELVARARSDDEPAVDELAAWMLDVARWLARERSQLEPALRAAVAVRAGDADDAAMRLLVSSFRDVRAEVARLATRARTEGGRARRRGGH